MLTRLPWSASLAASLPIVVVLPEPFTPTTSTTPRRPCGRWIEAGSPRIVRISCATSAEGSSPPPNRSRTSPTILAEVTGPTSAATSSPSSSDHGSATPAPNTDRILPANPTRCSTGARAATGRFGSARVVGVLRSRGSGARGRDRRRDATRAKTPTTARTATIDRTISTAARGYRTASGAGTTRVSPATTPVGPASSRAWPADGVSIRWATTFEVPSLLIETPYIIPATSIVRF